MTFSLFSIALFLIFLASLPFEHARAQTPPAPALGPRPTAPATPNVPSSPSSTGNAADLTGVWIAERKGKCWTEAGPTKAGVCDQIMTKLILTDKEGRISGQFVGPFSSWLRPDEASPQINSDGSLTLDAASFDGTTLRLSASYNPRKGCVGCASSYFSWVLTVDRDNPNVFSGIQRNWGGSLGSGELNYQLRLLREGGPIVQVRKPPFGGSAAPGGSPAPVGSPASGGSPSSGGSWIPWILVPGVGWVLYKLARSGRSNQKKEPKEYELDIRTQDDRTSLSPDGEDLLWVYGQVRCNKAEVNTEAMTAGLTFNPEGADAKWLQIGSPQRTNGFKTVPVRAWPPSESTQLVDGKPTVMVSAVIEGSKISGPVMLALEEYELEIF